MNKIISIVSEKGGTAKTISTYLIAEILRKNNFKVLLIDSDQQASLTNIYNYKNKYNITNLLNNDKDIKNIIENNFITSTNELENIKNFNSANIKNALKKLNYDFTIIDTAPRLDNKTLNLLFLSDYVLTPINTDLLSIKTLNNTIQAIKFIQDKTKIKYLGIFLTLYQDNIKLNQILKESLKSELNNLNIKLFKTTIHKSIAICESIALNKNINLYATKCRAYKDYINLTNEILKEIQK